MGRPPGSKNKPKMYSTLGDIAEIGATGLGPDAEMDTTPVDTKDVITNVALVDAFDKKLDYFQYTSDEHASDLWEHGDGVNPLEVPRAIKEKYPHLRFHWCSDKKWDRRGKNYDGWQKFSDPQLCPDGEYRANDLFLAAMPEERAQKRDRFVREKSTEAIKGVQERNLDYIAQIQQGASQGITPSGDDVRGIEIGRRPETNIKFGGQARKGGGYNRGLSREEIQEVIIKNQERAAKNRKYFT